MTNKIDALNNKFMKDIDSLISDLTKAGSDPINELGVDDLIVSATEELTHNIQSRSPKGSNNGNYRKGWSNYVETSTNRVVGKVYNAETLKKNYPANLMWLLENGHIVKRKDGEVMSQPIPHVLKPYQDATKSIKKEVSKRASKKLDQIARGS